MKNAVIIGVGPGLGLALTKKFLTEGFRACIIARNKSKLESYKDSLPQEGANAFIYEADAGNQDSLKSALNKIMHDHGVPTVLIYNVSLLRPAVPLNISYESFIEDFKINVAGMLTTYQTMYPSMREKGEGTIMITGGGLSINPYKEFTSLGVGKAGLRNLAISLAQDSTDSSINVYTITINGMIQEATELAPSRLADKFYEIFKEGMPPGQCEIILE